MKRSCALDFKWTNYLGHRCPSLGKGNFYFYFTSLHMFLTEFFLLKRGWPKWWTVFTQIFTCVFPLLKFHMAYLRVVLLTVINNGQKFVVRLAFTTGRSGFTIMSKCSIFLLVAEIISTSYTCELKFNVTILSHFFPTSMTIGCPDLYDETFIFYHCTICKFQE